MSDQREADTQHQELIKKGKSLGLKQAANMKKENLIAKIKQIEENKKELEVNTAPDVEADDYSPSSKAEVIVSSSGAAFLRKIDFDFEWFASLANQYNLDKFEFVEKFRAFRCYRDGQHVDWIDVNDMALLNGRKRLCEILLRHQPVTPKRRIINLPWR